MNNTLFPVVYYNVCYSVGHFTVSLELQKQSELRDLKESKI